MPYRRFAIFNFTGARAVGDRRATLAGFALGSIIPAEILDRYLYLIIAVVIALSFLPTAIHLYRENREEVHARVRSRGRARRDAPVPEEPPGDRRRSSAAPTRDDAWALLCEWTQSDALRKHGRAVEGAVGWYAENKFGV